ncbi:MAG TPA: RpiB/LacA/LacB family sugar-phosphate isomerase [Candidatus Paceibacterota bacterium]
MKIFIGSDHAGFELKEVLKKYLRDDLGYEVSDEGTFAFNPDDDYPDFVRVVAKLVAGDPTESRGIILGGSGQGEAMVANRFRHVRAAVYYGPPKTSELDIIKLSREHNDANILSLGARFLTEAEAKRAVKLWLEIKPSSDARHVRRIKKIDNPDRADNQF